LRRRANSQRFHHVKEFLRCRAWYGVLDRDDDRPGVVIDRKRRRADRARKVLRRFFCNDDGQRSDRWCRTAELSDERAATIDRAGRAQTDVVRLFTTVEACRFSCRALSIIAIRDRTQQMHTRACRCR
jgi:hypothetical protein